ncbi:uncharacterized protein LOC100773017 isoform X1 [Cricetulus griseus]|uniref:uncharacterized protein LOC100773017 isoform X1 n=1 Tax=Cricetulus griseus TaxID=10029 RepID=UPI0015C3430A|nr:uncharacterized protein LOC100773017 isoform X1 [Cricetulus griseus]
MVTSGVHVTGVMTLGVQDTAERSHVTFGPGPAPPRRCPAEAVPATRSRGDPLACDLPACSCHPSPAGARCPLPSSQPGARLEPSERRCRPRPARLSLPLPAPRRAPQVLHARFSSSWSSGSYAAAQQLGAPRRHPGPGRTWEGEPGKELLSQLGMGARRGWVEPEEEELLSAESLRLAASQHVCVLHPDDNCPAGRTPRVTASAMFRGPPPASRRPGVCVSRGPRRKPAVLSQSGI